MSKIKFVLPAAIAVAGMFVGAGSSSAKPVDSTKTKQKCAFCHVDSKAKPKELTEAGKYYHEKKTLEGYKPAK
jgi:hypothetical protein